MKEKNNVIIFWNEKDIFSDFYVSPFKYRGLTFFSIEQCVSWKLAKLQGNKELSSKILKENNSKLIRKIMREFKIKSHIISEHKPKYIKEILQEKYLSNTEFATALDETHGKTLVFASDKDFTYGSGIHYSSPSNYYVEELRGDNLYGKLLMDLRSKQARKEVLV